MIEEMIVHRDGPAQVRWSFRYGAFVVYWHDLPYGGCFYSRPGGREETSPHAIDLAHELACYPREIQQEWLFHGYDPAEAEERNQWLTEHGYGG